MRDILNPGLCAYTIIEMNNSYVSDSLSAVHDKVKWQIAFDSYRGDCIESVSSSSSYTRARCTATTK